MTPADIARMALKTHLAITGQNSFGGSWTGTLCGYENRRDDDEGLPAYATIDRAEVTCMLCKKIIGNQNHWRHRKYLPGTA